MMWQDVQDYSVTIASPCPPSLNPKAVRQVRDHWMLEFVHLPSVTTGKSSSFSAFHLFFNWCVGGWGWKAWCLHLVYQDFQS